MNTEKTKIIFGCYKISTKEDKCKWLFSLHFWFLCGRKFIQSKPVVCLKTPVTDENDDDNDDNLDIVHGYY